MKLILHCHEAHPHSEGGMFLFTVEVSGQESAGPKGSAKIHLTSGAKPFLEGRTYEFESAPEPIASVGGQSESELGGKVSKLAPASKAPKR